jgi:hypothetical protein
MDIPLDNSAFTELSSFIAAARKEGFSFKPSAIVKDREYAMELLQRLTEKASPALAEQALSVVRKHHALEIEHAILG